MGVLRLLRNGLVALLLLCLALRLMAWLLAPAFPAIVVMVALVALLQHIFSPSDK